MPHLHVHILGGRQQWPRLINMVKYLLFLTYGSLLLTYLHADRVESADGSVFYGQIIGIKDGNLTFESTYSSTIHIPLSEVVSLASTKSVTIRDDKNRTSFGQSIHLPSGQLNLRNSAGSSVYQFSDIQHLWVDDDMDPLAIENELLAESLLMKWKNSFGFDLAGASGNSDSLGIGLRVDSIYSNDFRELDLYLSYHAQKTNNLSDTDETKVGAEYDANFRENLAWYLRTDLEHDLVEQINLRATGAIGLKYDWIAEEFYGVSTRAGTAFRYEDSMIDQVATETEPALDFGLEYTHLIKNFILFESELTFLPNATNLSDYLFSHDTALNFPLGEDEDTGWNLRSGVAGTYDSSPAEGFKEFDIKYYLRMVYLFQ